MSICASLVSLLACWLATAMMDEAPATAPPAVKFEALGDEAVQDLLILGETRPIHLRIRVMIGDRAFRAVWAAGIRSYHARLDANGDGRLTTEEAEKSGLAALLNQTGQAATTRNPVELDVQPKDGVISIEELTEALLTSFEPFRLQTDSAEGRRTDALFDQLDRNKDGELVRSEMETIVGSLRRLDRDGDELIDVSEVSLIAVPIPSPMMQVQPVRDSATPSVLELSPRESPVRLARLLIKKYDKGSSRGPGRLDSRLSPEEFTIRTEDFSSADRNHDGTLNAEELRRYLTDIPRDAILDVAFTPDGSGKAVAVVRNGESGARLGMTVRQLSEDVVEVDVGPIRLDIHVDDNAGATEILRKGFRARFDSADANQDGYLEMDELSQDNGQILPLAGLFKALDRDGDGKIYPSELDEFIAGQGVAARGRLTMTASDEGRALFGMLDLDRDRRLGAREVLGTFARVSACDRDGDGRVTPDEIPHHIRLVLERGDISKLLAPPTTGIVVVGSTGLNPATRRSRVAVGPAWFRKMDRNRDGDVSPREFLGSRLQFDHLDRDHDGLLSPDEAKEASAARPAEVKAPGG